MTNHILSIDQGTTSSASTPSSSIVKAHASDWHKKNFATLSEQRLGEHHIGVVLWGSVKRTVHQALINTNIGAEQVAAIGITNQRRPTIVSEPQDRVPVYNTIISAAAGPTSTAE